MYFMLCYISATDSKHSGESEWDKTKSSKISPPAIDSPKFNAIRPKNEQESVYVSESNGAETDIGSNIMT